MRTPYDQFSKQILEQALSSVARIETDKEVTAPDVQRVDVYCVPDPARDRERRALGLLGEMITAPCLLEPFHQAPNLDELLDCLRKQLTIRHAQLVGARRDARDASTSRPLLWVIAAGRPDSAMHSLELRPLDRWPRGFYSAAPGLQLRLIVVSELPKQRETLLLRLLGASRVLLDALAELKTLPADAWEKIIAAPAVVLLRLTIPGDPALRSPEDEELAMTTSDLYESWKQRVHDEGLQEGLATTRAAIAKFYVARFGVMPANVRAALDAASDPETLDRWSSVVATKSKEEIDGAVLGLSS